MDCPFCSIDVKKTEIIQAGKNYYVALSNPRLVPGHLLVIPKRHIEKLSELNKKERQELFEAVIQLEEKILERYASGCDIRQHYRPFIKPNWVKVNHLHFHLQPREPEDHLYQTVQKHEQDLWQKLPQKERKKIVRLLKNPQPAAESSHTKY